FVVNAPATPVLSTLSLHDALPIWSSPPSPISRPEVVHADRHRLRAHGRAAAALRRGRLPDRREADRAGGRGGPAGSLRAAVPRRDRKSTRLNSSHVKISYAVFCLK